LLLAVGVKTKAFGLVLLTSLMLFPFAWGGGVGIITGISTGTHHQFCGS